MPTFEILLLPLGGIRVIHLMKSQAMPGDNHFIALEYRYSGKSTPPYKVTWARRHFLYSFNRFCRRSYHLLITECMGLDQSFAYDRMISVSPFRPAEARAEDGYPYALLFDCLWAYII